MEKIKILVAEDSKIQRDILIESLENYFSSKSIKSEEYIIIKAENFEKAKQVINTSINLKNYFDIAFIDIDFTEDNKGGKRDSGFILIEDLFEGCPLTKIVTYSGQFHSKDLWSKYEELKNRGLVVYSLDKSHSEGGEQEWMIITFNKIFNEYFSQKYIFDLWKNHELIKEKIRTIKLEKNQKDNLYLTHSIISDIDTIITLLREAERFDAKNILYRLIIQLYHHCLEQFCGAGKTENEIVEQSNKNLESARILLGENRFEKLSMDKATAIRKIIAYSVDDKLKFADKLNKYRNDSVHPDKKSFSLDFEIILFANLIVTVYFTNSKNIHYSNILDLMNKENNVNKKSFSDLNELIEYLKT